MGYEYYDLMKQFSRSLSSLGIAELLDASCAVIVGFSGGADSSLLLFLLREYLKNSRTRLFAAHLNHMIRGDEAIRDESFCSDMCEKYGVHLYTARRDIPALSSKMKCGTEECARRVRYDYFEECRTAAASECACAGDEILIATAHNENDNLETLLFNVIRGAGLAGIAGIAPIRNGIIRPMLTYGSEEIRTLCSSLGISYVNDSTNSSSDYTRNYIRQNLIPSVKSLNTRAGKAALRLTSTARCDNAYLEECAAHALGEYCDTSSVPLEILSKMPDALLPRALSAMYRRCRGNASDLSYVHITSCAALIRTAAHGTLSLPGGVRFVCDSNMVSFIYAEARDAQVNIEPCEVIAVPSGGGEFDFGDYLVKITENPHNCGLIDKNIYKKPLKALVHCDNIYGNLFIRARRDGDTLYYGGHTHRLKKLLCDRHIPAEKRDRLPLICDEHGILCVPGFPVRDGGSPDAAALYITFIEKALL